MAMIVAAGTRRAERESVQPAGRRGADATAAVCSRSDVDLDAPHGALYIQRTEMPEHAQAAWLRAAGRYRARIEGRGYTAHQDTRRVMGEHDSYRIQLWPRTDDRPAELRREWPGWTRLINPAPTDGVPADGTSTDS